VIIKPRVSWLWFSIHSPLDIAKEWWPRLAKSVASPYVFTKHIDFVFEIMVDGHIKLCNFVDILHDLLELLPMPSFRYTRSRIRDKEKSMNHFMNQSFFKFISTSILKQGS
jgi:hypothetical protein